MPKFSLKAPHSLTQEEATERLKSFTEKIKDFYKDQVSDLEQHWEDDQLAFGFTTFGMKISGRLAVAPNEVAVEGDIPLAAMLFKGKIESSIREQLTKILR